MKKIAFCLSLAVLILQLSSCSGLIKRVTPCDISNYTVDYGESKYGKDDMDAAVKTLTEYFKKNYHSCVLNSLEYMGDDYSGENLEYVTNTLEIKGYDECISLLANFSNADGEIDEFEYILCRKNGGEWTYVTHGAPYA